MIKMVQFSKIEIKDLTISIIIITLLFSYMFYRNSGGSTELFLMLIPISLLTIGLSFILHEIGHKVVAQKYGFFAEFRKWNEGLLLAVITAFFGFIFLAPGAVYIGAYNREITIEENGKISIAGPIVNIILAIIFLLIGLSLKPMLISFTGNMIIYLILLCEIGFNVNSFLALFNLLPIPMLDGSKVLRWNILVWFIIIFISGMLTYVSYTISFF